MVAFVCNSGDATVSVINNVTYDVVNTVAVGNQPQGIAVSPSGTPVYVTNATDGTVSVIDVWTAFLEPGTNSVTATISVGTNPNGVAVTPDGTHVYVANTNDGTLSLIDAATNTVVKQSQVLFLR